MCSKGQVSGGSFGKFKCFGRNGNGDNNEEEESNLVNDSNSKTATMAEEAKEELDSDKNPPASVSSRVIIVIVNLIFWLEIIGTGFVDECVYQGKNVFVW